MIDNLIISDMHVGDKRCNLNAVAELFGHVGRVKNLVIAGDLLDAWVTKTWDMEAIRALLRSTTFETCTVLKGNHDPDNLAELLGGGFVVSEDTSIETIDGRYVVIHGHQYDDILLQYNWCARWALYVQQWVYKQWGWDIQLLRQISLAKRNKTAYFKQMVTDVIWKMRETYSGCRGIICGHTHYPICVKFNDSFSYVNCGDLLETYSYVVVNNDGEVSLCGYFPTLCG